MWGNRSATAAPMCFTQALQQWMAGHPRSTTLRAALAPKGKVTVLTSSSGTETSSEDPAWEHGAFTKALLDAFNDPAADINHNGLISPNGLGNYVTTRVKSLTGGAQTPAWKFGTDTTCSPRGCEPRGSDRSCPRRRSLGRPHSDTRRGPLAGARVFHCRSIARAVSSSISGHNLAASLGSRGVPSVNCVRRPRRLTQRRWSSDRPPIPGPRLSHASQAASCPRMSPRCGNGAAEGNGLPEGGCPSVMIRTGSEIGRSQASRRRDSRGVLCRS